MILSSIGITLVLLLPHIIIICIEFNEVFIKSIFNILKKKKHLLSLLIKLH